MKKTIDLDFSDMLKTCLRFARVRVRIISEIIERWTGNMKGLLKLSYSNQTIEDFSIYLVYPEGRYLKSSAFGLGYKNIEPEFSVLYHLYQKARKLRPLWFINKIHKFLTGDRLLLKKEGG